MPIGLLRPVGKAGRGDAGGGPILDREEKATPIDVAGLSNVDGDALVLAKDSSVELDRSLVKERERSTGEPKMEAEVDVWKALSA